MSMLAWTFICPLIGFLILASLRDRLSETMATIVGVGSMALSAIFALMTSLDYFQNYHGQAVNVPLWTWLKVGEFAQLLACSLMV